MMNKIFKILSSQAFQVGFLLIVLKYFFEYLKFDKSFAFRPKKVTSPSITKSTAIDKARRLQSYLGRFGTDEKSVLSVFHNLNTSDYNLIYNSFGLVRYDSVTGTYGEYWGSDQDLTFWLFNELSDSEIKPIKERFNLSL